MTNNFKSQSTEARNSAVANIFSNVTVKQVAEKFIKKLRKAESFDEGKINVSTKIQIKSSDTFRVTIDGGFNENNDIYWCNIYIEEKMGNRFVHFSKSNNLRGNEGVWCKVLSALYYAIIDEITVMIDYELSRWEKEINREKINGTNFGWAIHKWETITGCEYVEVEESTEVTEEDVINEVVGVINANLIDDATEGQKLDWSLFNDSTMEYLFANGGPELYEKIKNGVKSRRIVEVLAYDDCFYVWYDEEPAKNDAPCLDDEETEEVEFEDMSEEYFKRREEQRNLAIELAEEDYEMKNYKERENYEEEDLKEYLANMLGRVYAHRCLKDDEEISIGDVVYMVKVFMEKLQELRGADLEYDALVLAKDKDMRVRAEFYEGFKTMESEIMIALLNARIFDAKCVAEGLNRMYWDTIIWENDDVAVKYTSPCEDFERGCLLVVEKESECMLGGWIDVSSNQDAVEHVVEEIEEFYENNNN